MRNLKTLVSVNYIVISFYKSLIYKKLISYLCPL